MKSLFNILPICPLLYLVATMSSIGLSDSEVLRFLSPRVSMASIGPRARSAANSGSALAWSQSCKAESIKFLKFQSKNSLLLRQSKSMRKKESFTWAHFSMTVSTAMFPQTTKGWGFFRALLYCFQLCHFLKSVTKVLRSTFIVSFTLL